MQSKELQKKKKCVYKQPSRIQDLSLMRLQNYIINAQLYRLIDWCELEGPQEVPSQTSCSKQGQL